MKILVTGSRIWKDENLIQDALQKYNHMKPVLIHGDCPTGADAIADKIARELGWEIEAYPADWSLGKKAGPLRNIYMVDLCPDVVLGFPTESSRGTIQCINYAKKMGNMVIVIDEKGEKTIYNDEIRLF